MIWSQSCISINLSCLRGESSAQLCGQRNENTVLIQAGVIYYTLTTTVHLNTLQNLLVSKADDCAMTPDPTLAFHLFLNTVELSQRPPLSAPSLFCA